MDIVAANPDKPWNYDRLSENLSKHPNITIEIIKNNPEKWNFLSLCHNPNITMEFINSKPRKPWNYKVLSANPNITIDIVKANPCSCEGDHFECEKPWDYGCLSQNPNITIDIVNSTRKHWNYASLSTNPNVTIDVIYAYPHKPWNWMCLSKNPNITMEMVIANPEKPWRYEGLSANPNLTFEFVNANSDKPWDYWQISQNRFDCHKYRLPVISKKRRMSQVHLSPSLLQTYVVMVQDSAMSPLPSKSTDYDLNEQIEITLQDVLGEEWGGRSDGSRNRSDLDLEDTHDCEKQNDTPTEANEYLTHASSLHKRTTPNKITMKHTAKKIKDPKKPSKPRGRPRGSGKKLYAVQDPPPLSDMGNVEHVLENIDQVEVIIASAVANVVGDNVPVVVGDEAPVVADKAPATVADGHAIAQQRVKDRAIAQGWADLFPFVERYKVPVGLTNNEINLLLSAMSEVVNEAVEKKERWKQEMRDSTNDDIRNTFQKLALFFGFVDLMQV
ncbi:hypothetical protein BDK51DRAFT_45127 [Blyttiomyces helicus]|uniref:Uncharacterized protein n=1 Tax=Blyttiomyces helicus TaxID=388810 RepID=A0A4P9WSL2_9FUNG|nr:hypothetical protein BDK51DRAFT_45127 [Blyttiomyces helicus]|eukprot:RKO94006.1 hypothetical protein BDK51DRAFT_45127 [Blyttiomyces helicus]